MRSGELEAPQIEQIQPKRGSGQISSVDSMYSPSWSGEEVFIVDMGAIL